MPGPYAPNDFLDMVTFLGQVTAQMPPIPVAPVQMARNPAMPRKLGEPARLTEMGVSPQPNVSNMPVLQNPDVAGINAADAYNRLVESKQFGTPFDPRMVEGMPVQDQLWMYNLARGTSTGEDMASEDAQALEAQLRKRYAGAPTTVAGTTGGGELNNMVHRPHQPGSPEGPNAGAIPGSIEHPIEQAYGQAASQFEVLNRALAGKSQGYREAMIDQSNAGPRIFGHPAARDGEGEHWRNAAFGGMNEVEAINTIIGAHEAMRMRLMGMHDPKFGYPTQSTADGVITIDPVLLNAMPGGSI